jgi:uncharacterized membrane protein (DUF106 family)
MKYSVAEESFDIEKIRAAREEMRLLQKEYAQYRREQNIPAAEEIQQQIQKKVNNFFYELVKLTQYKSPDLVFSASYTSSV